jgi:uncharacterized protein YbdZ (MbtH family)
MTKFYYIETKLGAKWRLVHTERRQTEALQYVKDHAGEKYPMRIVRVIRTIVFDGSKS